MSSLNFDFDGQFNQLGSVTKYLNKLIGYWLFEIDDQEWSEAEQKGLP